MAEDVAAGACSKELMCLVNTIASEHSDDQLSCMEGNSPSALLAQSIYQHSTNWRASINARLAETVRN